MWYSAGHPHVCPIWAGGGNGTGYEVSVCVEMPVGFGYVSLGVEMAKGHLSNPQIKTTFG